MRTKHLSFQLEDTVPGVFLLQGCCGGILSSFIYTVALCLWDQHIKLEEALFFLYLFFIVASHAGVIKATMMWAAYRLTKIQMGGAARVAITSTVTGVFALSIALLFDYRRPSDLAAWTLTLVLGGLPTAILIGSSGKPWNLLACRSRNLSEVMRRASNERDHECLGSRFIEWQERHA